MLPDCYNFAHDAALNKISARLVEAKEFILAYDETHDQVWNARHAFMNRWYGNVSERVCKELTGHFNARFRRYPKHFPLLRRFLQSGGVTSFAIINHFYMILADPYYRWAASDFLVERFEQQRLILTHHVFETEMHRHLPVSVGPGSAVRYSRNLLTALRDNGFLTGKRNKAIVSPALSKNILAYLLYAQADRGVGANEFDGSPIHLALLKPRELLVPLFLEGERSGYWEFTGDRNCLKANLQMYGLEQWLEAALK